MDYNGTDLFKDFMTVAPLLRPRVQEIQIPLRPTEGNIEPQSIEILPTLKVWFNSPKDMFNFKQTLESIENNPTYKFSGNSKDKVAVPEELQKAALIAEKTSGVPHSLILNFIRLESRFDPEQKNLAGSSACGYAHFTRDSLYAQLADLYDPDKNNNDPTSKLLKSMLPEDMPITYSAYIGKDGIPRGSRLTLLSPEKLDQLPEEQAKMLLNQDRPITNLSPAKAKPYCELVNKTEDINLTNDIHEGINKDPLISTLMMARYITDLREKLERAGVKATETNLYDMYQQGEGAGFKKAVLTASSPNLPAWQAFGDTEEEAKAKSGGTLRGNRPYYYNTDGTAKTLQQSQDYIAEEKGLSTKPLAPFKGDPAFTQGIQNDKIEVEYKPADSTLRHNLKELSQDMEEINGIKNTLSNNQRLANAQPATTTPTS